MRFVTCFLLALAFDFCAGLHTVALARRRVVLALWTGAILPPLSWLGFLYLIDATTRLEQALLLGCNSLAVIAGVLLTARSTRHHRRKKRRVRPRKRAPRLHTADAVSMG